MPNRRRLRALILAALVLGGLPRVGEAQATSTGTAPAGPDRVVTHTVKRGDTLWDLAARYLGNPFRWPEIYKKNDTLIQDPDLIEPGWVLAIVGNPQPTAGQDAAAAGAVPQGMPLAPSGTASPTARPAAAPVDAPRNVGGNTAALWAARRREAERVPYLVGLGGVDGGGRLVLPPPRSAGRTEVTATQVVQLYDRVRLELPKGTSVSPGMTLLTVRYGPTLKAIGRVAIPTGVLRVVSDSAGGIAELVTQFDQVDAEQLVIPAWHPPAVTDSVPMRVANGPTTTVLWIAGNALLPTPGTAILLSRGSGDGLRIGDQVTLVKQDRPARRRAPLPPSVDIAVAQVVRVTRAGASAILLNHVDAAIAVGTTGRVTARLP